MARDFDKGKGADWYRYPSRPGGPRHDELPPRRGSERPKPRKPFRPNRPGRKPARFKPPKPSVPRPRTPRPVSPKPQVPGAGRARLPRLPRLRVPGPFSYGLDLLDPPVFPATNPDPYGTPDGWCVSARCTEGPPNGWSGNIRRSTTDRGGNNCIVNDDCISGQAIGGTSLPWGEPHPFTTTGRHIGLWYGYWAFGGSIARYKHYKSYYRPGGPASPGVIPFNPRTWVPVEQSPDPNIVRVLPSQPDPFEPYVPGFAEGLPSPEGFANPELPYQPDYQWQYSFGVGLGPATIVDLAPSINSPGNVAQGNLPPTRPVGREPPGKGEKQRKVLTKSAKAGIALYRALDAASEASEIVDALYEALPDDVRKRWKCPDNRMGDSFGQYGFANADCKARALYYNLHRLDVVQGLKNIVKNQLEDAVIGAMQSKLPRNSGQAHSQGEKRFAKELDKFLCEELGLCDGDEDYERET